MKNEFTVKLGEKELKLKSLVISTKLRLEGQRIYASALKEANDKGLWLKPEVDAMLEAKGLLNTLNEEKKIAEVREKVKNLEMRLRRGINENGSKMTKEQGKTLALEIRKERNSLGEIGQNILAYYNNTADSYASNMLTKYFVYATTVNAEDGALYWRTFEDFQNDQTPVMDAAIRNYLKVQGADLDAEKNFYENKWLIQMGFMDNQLNFIDSKGRQITEDGILLDPEGRFINEAGEYIDRFNNRVDKEGNPLEDVWFQSKPETAKDANLDITNPAC
jgi:hypothetical protein